MPGKMSVEVVVTVLESSKAPTYCCCKPYYLSARDQERIDTVPWLEEGVLALREIDGFYDKAQHEGGNPDYTPWSIESVGKPGAQHSHWLSWVFGGVSRRTMKMMGGFPVTKKWGSVDCLFVARRRALGIVNHTLISDDTLCAHQNHNGPNDVPTPRVEELWRQELKDIDPGAKIDNLGW
jgi:hypothetical protein